MRRRLTPGLENICPPHQIFQHWSDRLAEIGEIGKGLAVHEHAYEFSGVDMNGVLQRGHLQFRKNQAQLLHRSCGSRASIAEM